MDVNGTKFHLLLGNADWQRCMDEQGNSVLAAPPEASPPEVASKLHWDQKRAELTLKPHVFQFSPAKNDKPPKLEDRRGAACDRFGNWYWIDKSETEILVNSAGTRQTSHFWSAGDGMECSRDKKSGDFMPAEPPQISKKLQLRGLAVTADHYLVVGTSEPAGLLIFDLFSGGPPQHKLWPDGAFAPFDMSPTPGGGLCILDRQKNKRLWGLDRNFNVIDYDREKRTPANEQEEEFQPADGSTKRKKLKQTFSGGISLAIGAPVDIVDPIAIEALPDSTVLILDRAEESKFSRICRYSVTKEEWACVSVREMLKKIEEDKKTEFTLIAHDFAFVPEHKDGGEITPDRLYVVEKNGNQAFGFNISQEAGRLNIEPLAEFFPLRLFGGKGLVTSGTTAYYDFSDRWIPLVEQKRPRYEESAELFTPGFNGGAPDCVWHRLMLDAVIPPETEIRIWSRAANEEADLQSAVWFEEPELYKRGDGSELPFYKKTKGRDTWELLFQKAKGRYLQLKMQIIGNGRATPRIHALRAYYPRFSYLEHYLPSVYREDNESASFLDRFLANIEGFFTSIEDKIAAVQMLFEVRSAPAEALEWLADWFGVALEPAWDEAKRRLFISHAMDFFQYRGTIKGLQLALHLALDACADKNIFADQSPAKAASPIRIIEAFRKRRTPAVVLGDPSELAGPRLVISESRWNPKHGNDDLHKRYTKFLQQKNSAVDKTYKFPITPPECTVASEKWTEFAMSTLGFIPSAGPKDKELWQDFLRRRYIVITELKDIYKKSYAAFSEVELPHDLPADGAPLVDWYQFETMALPMHTYAHRFTVMLPMPKGETPYSEEHQKRIELAKRIVDLEKPAHTIFEVKFYWNMFRIGEVRLGYDTALDLNSRISGLMTPMILGQRHIGESYVGFTPAQEAGRHTVGCGPLKNKSALINRESDYEHICRQ